MTKEEADFIGSMNMCDEISNEAYKKIMCNCKVEEEECEDCISRESVRQLVCKNNDKYGYNDRFHEFTEECLQLPSVTPKMGHWINMSEGFSPYECSKCGAVEFKISKYCPNCGADMREGETDAG